MLVVFVYIAAAAAVPRPGVVMCRETSNFRSCVIVVAPLLKSSPLPPMTPVRGWGEGGICACACVCACVCVAFFSGLGLDLFSFHDMKPEFYVRKY